MAEQPTVTGDRWSTDGAHVNPKSAAPAAKVMIRAIGLARYDEASWSNNATASTH